MRKGVKILSHPHFKMPPIEIVQKTSKITTFRSISIGSILKPIFKTIFKNVIFIFPFYALFPKFIKPSF